MAQSLFEVHTLKGGQWVIDSTYPDRDTSIEVAKQLHGEKRFEGIKVIKDTFDPRTGQGKELVVFDTSKAPKDRPAAPPPPGKAEAPAAATATAAPAAAPRSKKKGKNQDVSVALKATGWLVVIVIGGLGVLFLINKAGALFSQAF